MQIVRRTVVVVIVMSCAGWGGGVDAAPDGAAEARLSVSDEASFTQAMNAERDYRHGLARLRRLRQIAVRNDATDRVAEVDALRE